MLNFAVLSPLQGRIYARTATRIAGLFNNGALGQGISWATVESNLQITMQVTLVPKGKFTGTLFGKPVT